MNLLLKIALKNRKQLFLVIFTIISMCCLTFASQLEILTIGIVTQKVPVQVQESTQQQQGVVDKAVALINNVIDIENNVIYLAVLVIVVGLFKAIALFSYRFTTKLIAIRVSRDLRQEYFEHMQALPMNFYQQHNIGSLSSRVVTDAVSIAEGINATLINYLQTPFTILTTLILCFYTSWKLSLIIFFGFPLIMLPIVFLARKVKRIAKQLQKNQETFSSVLIEFLAGIQTVKIFAMEEFSLKKYREQNNRMAMLQQKSARYDLSSRPIVHTIAMFFLATVMLSGLYLLKMNVSEILVYCGFIYIFYEPVKKFAEENCTIQRGAAAAERMQEVMSLNPQIQDQKGALTLSTFQDSIEFDQVWFRYNDEWVLRNLSFTVKKGQTVAITGPTGAGKSTIVQLLPRLYDVEKGEVRIDGKPLQTYSQKSLREAITFVPQKPFLFLDTVAENIAFGRPFSREQISRAARQAHAEEFIVRLPQGYDTELSEAGKNLSVGQQQRLAIARALLKDASILVMDEATSSLDAISENHIKTAIQQLHGQVTQIIIAHRLSTIEDADKIIYLEQGEKVAEGSKDELLNTCAGFRLMWEMMHRQTKNKI